MQHEDEGEGEPFDGLGVATCPRDLTMMDVAGTLEAPYWQCPVCGPIRMTA